MNLSLKPIFKYFKRKIKNKIHFYYEKNLDETKKRYHFLKSGEDNFF